MRFATLLWKLPKDYKKIVRLCMEINEKADDLEMAIQENDALLASIIMSRLSSLVLTLQQEVLSVLEIENIRKSVEEEFQKIHKHIIQFREPRKAENRIIQPLVAARNLVSWIYYSLLDVVEKDVVFDVALAIRSGVWVEPITESRISLGRT